MSSLKNLLYDERYIGDNRYYTDAYLGGRYWDQRYWNGRYHPRGYLHDRYWRDHWYNGYGHGYYPRYWNGNYWNYWEDKPISKEDNTDTLRFNRSLDKSNPPTRVYYPFTTGYVPPVWTAPVGVPAEVKLERVPLKRSNSIVNIVETTNETKVDGVVVESNTEKKVEEKCDDQVTCSMQSKSCSNIGDCEVKPVINSVTYVYDNDKDKHRHVTYVRHSHNAGESLAGNLVKASPTFLPCTRSVGAGPIFNGTNFGILSEHFTIRDAFHVAFQFKTTQQNGVLLSICDRLSTDAFFIELYDSQLKATLFVDGEADSCWTDFPTAVLSNDIWSDVEITILNNRISMTVRNEVFTKTHRFPFRRPIRGDIFIGGFPAHAAPPFCCRSRDFFVGEMRNFFLNNDGVKWYGTPSYTAPRLRNWFY